VRVGAGATWGELDRATQEHGLATTGGRVSTTGVAGLTLGGGSGWLERKHGLSCDSLVAADLVTWDGRVVRASEDENPELLWALRGGGGSFGVVTALELELHPLDPDVYAGIALFRGERAGEILRVWRDVMTDAPEELSLAYAIFPAPAEEEIPAYLHGEPTVLIAGMWAGDPADGERATRGLRELATPLLDLSKTTTYLEMQRELDAYFPAGLRYYWKALYLDGLPDAAIDATVDWSLRRRSDRTLVVIRHCGGAIARVGAEETAFGDRSSEWMLSIDATWDDPADDERNIGWTRAFWDDCHRFSQRGKTYFNFPGLLEEGDAMVRASYGANHARLARIKAQYDPGNLFRLNQNIRPAA
jgi:FAD/FMN-containing dehydrogenase